MCRVVVGRASFAVIGGAGVGDIPSRGGRRGRKYASCSFYVFVGSGVRCHVKGVGGP